MRSDRFQTGSTRLEDRRNGAYDSQTLILKVSTGSAKPPGSTCIILLLATERDKSSLKDDVPVLKISKGQTEGKRPTQMQNIAIISPVIMKWTP